MKTTNRSKTITFRLPIGVCDALDELATAQGISRGNWARGQVLAAISRPDKDDLVAILNHLASRNDALEKRLIKMEKALVNHLYYTLTLVGSIEHSKAESFAIEKLFPESK